MSSDHGPSNNSDSNNNSHDAVEQEEKPQGTPKGEKSQGKRTHEAMSRSGSEDDDIQQEDVSTSSHTPREEKKERKDKYEREDKRSKRPRLEREYGQDNNAPSRVVFVRQLPPATEVHDLEYFTQEIGGCTEIVLLRNKLQAFIEFKDVDTAVKFIDSNKSELTVRGKTAYLTYSNRSHLAKPQDEEQPNNIVLVVLSNVLYPITVDVLHDVFCKYGVIQKIVVFTTKTGHTQGLVQYTKIEEATAARHALDEQNIYKDCCHMKVIYSKITELNVKHNDERSRDYRSSLRSEEGRGSGILGNHPLSRTPSDYYDEPRYRSERSERSDRSDYNDPRDSRGRDRDGMKGEPTPVVLVSNLDDRKTTPDHIFTLFGVYGDVEKVKVLPTKRDTALVQFANVQGAETCLQFLRNGVPLFGGQLHIQRSKHFNINSPTNNDPDSELFRSYYNSSYHRFRHAGSKNLEHICAPSRTLHVSNVNAQLSEDEVQRVFERYGNVEMVRFFGSKRSSSHNRADGTEKKMATVRMDTLEAGVRALVELHEREISRMPIKITFSEKRSDMIPDPKPSDRRQREEREAPRDERREDRNAPRETRRDSREERRDDRPKEATRDERDRDDRRDAPRESRREERRDTQRDERRDAPRDSRRDERDAPRNERRDDRREERDAPRDDRRDDRRDVQREDRKRDDQDPRKAPRETKRDSREGRERDRNERREVAPRRHH